ncbi:MAG: DUF4185 domain-containing protein [Propionibacteriaceae bacterium]|nr:DUF4185 domain-containing protein [Propionibacteriaceae bacterium]
MKKSLIVLAVVTILAPLSLAASHADAHGRAPNPPGRSCSLVNQALQPRASTNAQLTKMFTQYGNTSGKWSGADSTYSVRLKNGNTAWLFSDTFYGRVNRDGSRPADTTFINNSIVLQKGSKLVDTITGGTPRRPAAIIPPKSDTSWYWLGAGALSADGKTLYLGALNFTKFPPYGMWDFGWESTSIASVDTRTWKLNKLTPAPSGHGVQWASWFQQVGDHTYIYGVEDLGLAKYMHVARVRGKDLSKVSAWQYWTGSRWSGKPGDSARVMAGVGNEYSVTPFRDGYLLVTQDTNELFSSKVLGYTSCSPTGPFVNPVTLFEMAEVGALGSYGDPDVFAYNAHVHPELSSNSRLLVTYNVNSFDNVGDVYDDVSIYRPRFIDVTIKTSR